MRQKDPVGKFKIEPVADGRRTRLRDGLVVYVPVTITFTPDDARWPTIALEADEHSGTLGVTKVTLEASPGAPIGSDDVRVYSLPKLLAIAVREFALPAVGWDGYDQGETWPPSNKAVMESIVAATRSRTSVDRERLDDVARHYTAGRIVGVEAALNVSRSQAYRLVKLAREAGLIDEEENA